MQPRVELSLVIPAYNEELRLPRTLAALSRFRESFAGNLEVIVVDDGSCDGTVGVAQGSAGDLPGLRVIGRPHRGKGAAVRAGMLAAGHPWIILCDADLSMPVDQIHRLLQALLDGCQIAVGSRELPESRRYQEPAHRHLMGRAFNLLVQLALVRGLRDTQCGFKGFQRDVARELFGVQQVDGFGFDAEILFLARRRGYRIGEVPIDWYFDADSRVRPARDTLGMALDLAHIRLNDLRGAYRRRPVPVPADEAGAATYDSGAPIIG
jgi:glycosyltransferase involved in cell wall biosynthesis